MLRCETPSTKTSRGNDDELRPGGGVLNDDVGAEDIRTVSKMLQE
jgi:hypothetical protein